MLKLSKVVFPLFFVGLSFAPPASADFLGGLSKSVNRKVDRKKREIKRKVDRETNIDRNLNRIEKKGTESLENFDTGRGVRECKGTEKMLIENETIRAEKKQWAIVVTGACELTLKNVNITGSRGVLLKGAGKVDFDQVKILTQRRGLVALGTATIHVNNSNIRVRSEKNATLESKGAAAFSLRKTNVRGKKAMNFSGTTKIDVDDASIINGKPFSEE